MEQRNYPERTGSSQRNKISSRRTYTIDIEGAIGRRFTPYLANGNNRRGLQGVRGLLLIICLKEQPPPMRFAPEGAVVFSDVTPAHAPA